VVLLYHGYSQYEPKAIAAACLQMATNVLNLEKSEMLDIRDITIVAQSHIFPIFQSLVGHLGKIGPNDFLYKHYSQPGLHSVA
jgi:hypothetical protein